MTFPLRVAREVVKEAFGENPDLAADAVYELEKLAKMVIRHCAEIVEAFDVSMVDTKDVYRIRDRVLALATEEEK